MHQSIGKKKKIFLYLILLIFLSSINNKFFASHYDNLFIIKQITISGLENDEENILSNKLNYLKNNNILFINKSLVEAEIYDLNFIEFADVKKIYPSSLLILIKKAKIIATTIKDNKEYLIGSNGKFITNKNYGQKNKLPKIFGNFKIVELLEINKYFMTEGFAPETFDTFYYFKSKRWDIKIDKNLLVKLPRQEPHKAIKKLKIILENIENSKYKIVDLRVPNQIILN